MGCTDSNHDAEELTTIWYANGEVVCDGLIPYEWTNRGSITLAVDENEVTLAVLDGENAREKTRS